MKAFFTLIFLLTACATFAQRWSRLTITALITTPVSIMVDNRPYQSNGSDGSIELNQINPGYHTIRIYKQRSNGWRRISQVLYESNINIRRGYDVDVLVNRFGKAFVDEQLLQDNDHDSWNNNGQQQAMEVNSFIQLKQTLSHESFDQTRTVIAKQAISANKFTSQQSKELVMLFTYDNSKLEIAKYLYAYTVDKSNYMVVYDAFSYSSSKEELARYIQQYR